MTFRHARKAQTLVLGVALALGGLSLGAAADSSNTDESIQKVTARPATGAKRPSPEVIAAHMRTRAVASPLITLPSSVDLSSEFPPPDRDGQGNLQSCTGWATGYALKTFQEKGEMGWNITTTNHIFSPNWLWNQNNGGNNWPALESDVLDTLVSAGCDTESSFPASTTDYWTQPSTASFNRAAHFKANDWYMVPPDVFQFKAYLTQNTPIIIEIYLFDDFYNLNATTNKVYDSAAGTCWEDHVMTVIGYNDSMSAFKFINSWGTAWGSNGYGWISYSFLTNPNIDLLAFIVDDGTNTPPVPN
jgi:C1A family cysteine protease